LARQELTSELRPYHDFVPFEELDNPTRVQPVQKSHAEDGFRHKHYVGWCRKKSMMSINSRKGIPRAKIKNVEP